MTSTPTAGWFGGGLGNLADAERVRVTSPGGPRDAGTTRVAAGDRFIGTIATATMDGANAARPWVSG